MKDKVSAAEIDPGPIKNNSQILEAMNEVHEEEPHVDSMKQESIADVPREDNTPPPNNESYPGKRTKPTTTITDKQDKFVQKMVCVAAELEREYDNMKKRKGLYFTEKERAFEDWCKRRKQGKTKPTIMATPTQNINRQPMNHPNGHHQLSPGQHRQPNQ